MRVTRSQIVLRGLSNECPNCGSHTLFKAGTRFTINPRCGACGLSIDRGDGFFLGAFVVNYTVTVLVFVVPAMVLYVSGVLGLTTAAVVAGAGALFVPVLLYRCSWSWWLMGYFLFLPQKLPNNRTELAEDREE